MSKSNRTVQRSLNEQLSNLTGNTMTRTQIPRLQFNFVHINNALPPCARWKGDGIDHINISPKGKTELGRALHTSFDLRFLHDVFGPSNSISKLWNNVDELVGSKAVQTPEVQLPYLLADAMWQKVRQYPKLADEIKASQLPFDMYQFSVVSDMPFRPSMSYWWLEGIYAIKEALIENKESPDFAGLIQGKFRGRKKIITEFLTAYVPNRRNSNEQAEEQPKEEGAQEAPSLVRELRATPPLVIGVKKFSLAINARTGQKEKKAERGQTSPVIIQDDEPAMISLPDGNGEAVISLSDSGEQPMISLPNGTEQVVTALPDGSIIAANNGEDTVRLGGPDSISEFEDGVVSASESSLDGLQWGSNITVKVNEDKDAVVEQPVVEDSLGEFTSLSLKVDVPEEVEVPEPAVNPTEGGEPVASDAVESQTSEPIYGEQTAKLIHTLLTTTNDDGVNLTEVVAKFETLLNDDPLFQKAVKETDFEVEFRSETYSFIVVAAEGSIQTTFSMLTTEE